jgi:hypothetical protein
MDASTLGSISTNLDFTSHVQLLERGRHFDAARSLLADKYVEAADIRILNLWLSLDRQRWDDLKRACLPAPPHPVAGPKAGEAPVDSSDASDDETAVYLLNLANNERTEYRDAPTTFTPYASRKRSDPLSNYLSMLWLRPFASNPEAFMAAATTHKRAVEEVVAFEEAHPIPEVDSHAAIEALQEYDALRESQKELARVLTSSLKEQQSPAALGEKQAVHEQHRNFQDMLIKDRGLYLSFEVVSPSLARAEQLIYVSKMKGYANPKLGILPLHDRPELRAALRTMERVAGQDNLLEADMSVRDQFMKVYSLIKNMAGSAEFEDLKVLGTLTDSVSKEKVLGHRRWWGK